MTRSHGPQNLSQNPISCTKSHPTIAPAGRRLLPRAGTVEPCLPVVPGRRPRRLRRWRACPVPVPRTAHGRSGLSTPSRCSSAMCSAARRGASPPFTSTPAPMLRWAADSVRLALPRNRVRRSATASLACRREGGRPSGSRAQCHRLTPGTEPNASAGASLTEAGCACSTSPSSFCPPADPSPPRVRGTEGCRAWPREAGAPSVKELISGFVVKRRDRFPGAVPLVPDAGHRGPGRVHTAPAPPQCPDTRRGGWHLPRCCQLAPAMSPFAPWSGTPVSASTRSPGTSPSATLPHAARSGPRAHRLRAAKRGCEGAVLNTTTRE